MEQLAWCVVQIHCLLHFDDNKIKITKKDTKILKEQQILKNNITNRDTSFNPLKDERGQVVFSTKPKFLFCDLKLKRNESQLFHFSDNLPDYSPPSYNGTAIKYFYKITIGIQRVNSTIQLLRMPIKVLNIQNEAKKLNDSQNSNFSNSQTGDEEVFSGSINQTSDQIDSNNPQVKQNEIINSILHKLDCLSSNRTLNSYIITNHLGKLGKFCIFKSIFKLGEDIIGYFDLTDGEIPCVQFTVTLQSEEIVNEDYRITKKGLSKCSSHLTNYSQCQEFCLHSQNAQISLPIPLTITPTFETNLITLNWRLYFEFVTTKTDELSNEIYEDDNGRLELSPKELNVQTMIWELPITILPTNPSKIGQGLQLPDTSIIIV